MRALFVAESTFNKMLLQLMEHHNLIFVHATNDIPKSLMNIEEPKILLLQTNKPDDVSSTMYPTYVNL
jgi:hypothetical protein